jgi:aryl-alcohol dehydrogenase-like predicted oxidoreductase
MLTLGIGLAATTAIGGTYAQSATAPVLTRAIPRTGGKLPVIGLGTAIVFDIGNDTAQRAERTKVIQTLIDGDARMIDTAPSYGTAETVVGDLLADMKVRDKVFLATKVRSNNNDAFSAQRMDSQ